MNKIKLNSRYKDDNNYLEKVDENIYKLVANFSYRVGFKEDPNNIIWVDPSGGPMMVVGEKVTELNRTIKSIECKDGTGIFITFEV